jgi:hypothetical protein
VCLHSAARPVADLFAFAWGTRVVFLPQNSIREKQQALNFLRLSARMDAVASRVDTAIRMNTVSASMGDVVKGMDSVLGSMDPQKVWHSRIAELTLGGACVQVATQAQRRHSMFCCCWPIQIANVMDKFEKQFEDLDVRSGYMESAIDSYVPSRVQMPRCSCSPTLSPCCWVPAGRRVLPSLLMMSLR